MTNARNDDLENEVWDVIDNLPQRQREVLTLRFGLEGNQPHTLEAISQKFGVSRERIRQIEQKALRKLRHPTHKARLEDYLD